MAETKQTGPSLSKRRSWLRKLAIAAGSFVVLLVVLYFVATSSAFFKGVILPRVSKSLNAEITVADASISPFSQVVLKDLNVKTTGSDPLLQVQEVRLRYSLWSILGGNIKVDEVTVASPALNVVQNADGTSNLDPLLKKETAPAQPSAEPSKPLQLDVRNVAFKNVKVIAVINAKDGSRQTVELSDVNVTLDQLKNGAAGKLTL
ncbi:MAG TPA: AsmA family protein, partial [Verrucomicrobiae bacterium]|nr:AsmA family protein [Verrucomicrobiae bacterium]